MYVRFSDAISVAADPSVSPADTIREALTDHLPDGFRDEDGVWHDGPVQRDAFAALDVLLAVGERDKAAIHELEVKLTGYEEFRAARTEADPEKDDIWEFYDRKLWATIMLWKDRALAAESAGERDGRQIAQLTEALEPFAAFGRMAVAWEDGGGWRWASVPGEQLQRIPVWFGSSDFGNARAVLAGEEDANG